jgi:hypothetical protein
MALMVESSSSVSPRMSARHAAVIHLRLIAGEAA